jgi:hypothetical protein
MEFTHFGSKIQDRGQLQGGAERGGEVGALRRVL